jgi:SulP family sulfate permease
MHAATLLLVVLVFAPLASSIPLAVLAAVLFVVAWNMGEWREIPGILRLDAADIVVWLITFALTVMADLTVAVEAGLALAALLYIYRVTETTSVSVATPEYIAAGEVHSLQGKDVPPYVTILRIHGPFLFGTTDKLSDVAATIGGFQPIVVLRLRNMTAIDATGLHALEQFSYQLRRSGRTLVVCGARHQPADFLKRAEFVETIGSENIVPHVSAAIARAREIAARPDDAGRTGPATGAA